MSRQSYSIARLHRDTRALNLDIGRGERPLRVSLWRSRQPRWGVQRLPRNHQLRVHAGRRHLTVGRFVWRKVAK